MAKFYFILVAAIFLATCNSKPPQQAQTTELRRVAYSDPDQVDQLRKAGAKIIVQEPDYVVIRTDSMISALSLPSSPIAESDLVQRLIYVIARDSGDVQKIINTGIDFWQVKGDTVIARAFDIYIERLKAEGFTVTIIETNAQPMEEKQP
ncbi:MAG: hypothetical protein ACOY90_11130 [Candidatus Zhuqueibacterota bacterium]